MVPTIASATYIDCRNARGSMMGCFWEAAMKDGNVLDKTGGGNYNHKKVTKTQLKELLLKRKDACSKLPVKAQKNCLMKGIKLNKKIIKKGYMKLAPLSHKKKAVQR